MSGRMGGWAATEAAHRSAKRDSAARKGRMVVVVALLAGCRGSATPPAGVVLRDARAFEAKSGGTAAAYVTIVNHTDSADVLDSVTTRVARFASLHSQKTENGYVTMAPLEHPAIAPGDSLVLQPGSDHLMLESVDRDLVAGAQLPLTFWFHRAGRIDVSASVRPYGS